MTSMREAAPSNMNLRSLTVLLVSLIALAIGSSATSVEAQRRGRGRDTTTRRVAPPAAPTTVVFDALPEGAEVLIDEERVGVGPMGPVTVTPGPHTIRVRLEGFTEYTDVIDVAEGQDFHVPVDLFPLAHVLVVESNPVGARLFVDERYAGDTPLDVELLDGEHQLRLSLLGYEDVRRAFSAVSGQRDRWSVELELLTEQGPPEWYEDPVIWIVTGVSVVAVVTLAIVIAVVAQPGPNALDEFCAGDRCIRFDPF